jgi:hypothetical protein
LKKVVQFLSERFILLEEGERYLVLEAFFWHSRSANRSRVKPAKSK